MCDLCISLCYLYRNSNSMPPIRCAVFGFILTIFDVNYLPRGNKHCNHCKEGSDKIVEILLHLLDAYFGGEKLIE